MKIFAFVIGFVLVLPVFSVLSQEEKPQGIPEDLFNDPEMMVREAVESIDGTPIIWKYITEHPELYRKQLLKLANEADEVRDLIKISFLGAAVLKPADAMKVVEKTLNKLPDSDDPLVSEARGQLIELRGNINQLLKVDKNKFEKKPEASKPKPKRPSQTPEPTFVKKPLAPDKKLAESKAIESELDNPFPYWIFIIGSVVVVGLLVLLRRK